MKIQFSVTQEMIDTCGHSSSNCPVATAINLALEPLGLMVDMFVTFFQVSTLENKYLGFVRLPPCSAITQWIRYFDCGKPVTPFTGEVESWLFEKGESADAKE